MNEHVKSSHLLLRILTEVWFTQYNLILKLQHRETQSAVWSFSAHTVTGYKGVNMSLPFPAEQTDPHTGPAAQSEQPLTARLLPGRLTSLHPEYGDRKGQRGVDLDFGMFLNTA